MSECLPYQSSKLIASVIGSRGRGPRGGMKDFRGCGLLPTPASKERSSRRSAILPNPPDWDPPGRKGIVTRHRVCGAFLANTNVRGGLPQGLVAEMRSSIGHCLEFYGRRRHPTLDRRRPIEPATPRCRCIPMRGRVWHGRGVCGDKRVKLGYTREPTAMRPSRLIDHVIVKIVERADERAARMSLRMRSISARLPIGGMYS
jgi:hypothetical protein